VFEDLEPEVQWASELSQKVLNSMSQRIIGQPNIGERLLMALMTDGHILLEGLPGLAKTTSVKTLAELSELSCSRIQFTPDMLPADVIGTQIYNPKTSEYSVKKGPVFANLVIADEINRAPAKVQSALLQAMQERQVTIGDTTFSLEQPFLVMATQNPIEQEGTYPLPEAQVDRFLFKVVVNYGSPEDEVRVVSLMMQANLAVLDQVLKKEDLGRLSSLLPRVHVVDKLRRYIVNLVFATRPQSEHSDSETRRYIAVGASPRASINLEKAARANAIINGRSYVTPQDVKDVAMDVLRHRVIRSYEAEAEEVGSEVLVSRILERVDVP